MKIAIINIEDGDCQATYSDDAPSQTRFGGPWGWPENTVHVQIPEELASELSDSSGNVSPKSIRGEQDENSNWSIVENS